MDDHFSAQTRTSIGRLTSLARLVLLTGVVILTACGSQDRGSVVLNQTQGLELPVPGFLQARAVNPGNLDVSVSVEVDGVNYNATRTQQGSTWIGEVYVPSGSDATLNILWFETDVPDLPDEYDNTLPLAISKTQIDNIDQNRAISIDINQYVTENNASDQYPQLDVDGDNVSNLKERLAGSRPNDANDTPAEVLILYNPLAPTIDGRYDSIWNTAQFQDLEGNNLNIDNLMIDRFVTVPGEDRKYRWAGMHNGESLFLLVFAEAGDQQTPFGDSVKTYDDDAVDIYWDGNNSKLDRYDGIDDFQAIIPLLSNAGAGNPNSTDSEDTRFALGDQSTPIDMSAFDFSVCLCTGAQQLYEIKIDLQLAKIPVDSTFGFEVQLNNDVNGGERDAKWAWHDDSGADNTWRFPLKMGTARLELPPQ